MGSRVNKDTVITIERYAKQFRSAIESAYYDNMFWNESPFSKFPNACCGVASTLLAQYLIEQGIHTYYVCGNFRDCSFDNIQSHAWLITDEQIIIDITGEQFSNNPIFMNYNFSVYVGKPNGFYELFDVEPRRDITENISNEILCTDWLKRMYCIIIDYLK